MGSKKLSLNDARLLRVVHDGRRSLEAHAAAFQSLFICIHKPAPALAQILEDVANIEDRADMRLAQQRIVLAQLLQVSASCAGSARCHSEQPTPSQEHFEPLVTVMDFCARGGALTNVAQVQKCMYPFDHLP